MLGFAEALAEVMFKFVGIIMKFAPIGIGAAMAVTVSHSGIGVILNLGKLVLTLYARPGGVRAARAARRPRSSRGFRSARSRGP